MAFNVYPGSLTNPLSVAASATSVAESITEHIAPGAGQAGADAMLMRLAMINPMNPCAAPGPDHPGIILIAGGGTPVTLLEFPAYASIFNGGLQYVAAATYVVEANGVYQITVDFLGSATGPGNSWEIQIQNTALASREFTWVVADNMGETSQPWMELSQDLDLDTVLGGDILLTGQNAQIALPVTNKGTGPLTISDAAGPLGGSDFEIISVPGPIDSSACDDILLQFNAPASSGISSFDYDVGSDDTTATVAVPTASHNRRVALSGTAGKLEVMLVLDASGSMAYLPDGSAPGVAVSDMRWGHMKSAAQGFLDLLSAFADDLGRVGVVLFPDIVSGVPDPSIADSIVLQNAIDIPADVNPIKDLLDDHTPTAGEGNTPIGHGIGTTMGTAAGSFGEFLGSQDDVDYNPRWMVVMSDGFHNLGPPEPPDFYGLDTDPTSFRGKNVRVIAVSYGDPGAANWPPDPAQMQALSAESDGVYVDAGTNDTGLDPGGDLGLNVAKSFRAAVVAGLYLDPTVDPGVTLTANSPEVRREVLVLPYDTKVCFAVNWASDNPDRVNVQILAPDCRLITAAVAEADPDIKYSRGNRYQMFTFNNDYLRNTGGSDNGSDDHGDNGNGGQPRDGTWTLVISSDGLDGGDSEAVEYEIITQSRLRMRVNTGRARYYAGDDIDVSAMLTLDGKPIRNASVSMRVEKPGSSFNNWFTRTRITPQEFDQAKADLGPIEVTGIAVKTHALTTKGLRFNNFSNTSTLTLTDADDSGVYSASISGTSVPGTYTCHVLASGETEDGKRFRREQRLQMYLDVRPLPDFTLVDVAYSTLFDDRLQRAADVTVWPRDAYGNALLVDTDINPAVVINPTGGELRGPLVANLDGSYSQRLAYPENTRPAFELNVSGNEVIRRFETAPLDDLRYVDKLVDFRPGSEVQKGANQHNDPHAALGDALGSDSFVSLGANGSISLGVIGENLRYQGDDDITVFVRSDPTSDRPLRAYEVQAKAPGDQDNWVSLGESAGTTQAFSLRSGGLKTADAIRIIDKSGVVLEGPEPSPAPGVSIMGVGFKQTGLKPEDGGGILCCFVNFFRCLFGGQGKS